MYSLNQIETVGVVGAGVMGAGIAQLAAQAGYAVLLYDHDASMLPRARQQMEKNLDGAVQRQKMTAAEKDRILDAVQTTHQLDAVRASFIIEAVVEKLDVKVQLFRQLAAQNGPQAILATNTSSIPISRMARETPQPERVVGMHFFNPAHIMKLVEVIRGAATDQQVAAVAFELAEKMGKKPVYAADSAGFIVNRVARPFYVEGLKAVEDGITDLETMDQLMEAHGFKMGPFRLMDLIGVDANFNVTQSMYESFWQESRFRPSRMQQQKVDAGHHGRKTGRGFYHYDD